MSKKDYKTFKKEDLGKEFFFVCKIKDVPQIRYGELEAIITVDERPIHSDLVQMLFLKYITRVFLKLYCGKDQKHYTVDSQDVHDNYTDACEAYKKYIR